MTFKDALDLIPYGNCLLFVGAGFGHLAKNKSGDFLPLGGKLADILDEKSGFKSEGDLKVASEFFRDTMGDGELIDLLNDHLTPMEPTEAQIKIVRFPWKRIYTTNYDDCVEIAGRKSHIARKAVDRWHTPNDFKNKRDIVIHLNGSLSTLKATSLDADFKLTDGSYLGDELNNNPWREFLKNDLLDCQAAFFVGFSMGGDLELSKIVYNAKNIKEKSFFIVKDTNAKNLYQLKKFGSVENIGAENFASYLDKLPKVSEETSKLKISGKCFIQSGISQPVDTITDGNRRDLFIWGKYGEPILKRALTFPNYGEYFIYRTKLQEVINLICNGVRNIVVHGNIGNGKSLFVAALTIKLANEGYEVYRLKNDSNRDISFSDLEYICSRKGIKTAIVVEQYNLHKDVLEKFNLWRCDTVLITTARTVYNDMNIDWLQNQVKGDVKEVNLNRLDDNEVAIITKIFETNGFWADLSWVHTSQKESFIKDECKRSLRVLLLRLLETKSVKDSMQSAVNTLKNGAIFRDCLILMLISSYLGLNLDMDMIGYGLNKNIDSSKIERDPVIREFVSERDGSITKQSSLVAEVLLGSIVDVEVVKDVLVRTFRQFDNMRDVKMYKDVLSNLLTFRILRQPLNANVDKFHKVIGSFYEGIRDCEFCKHNPLFWLQYAIAVLDEEDYKSAKIYFESAYAYAKKRKNFDSYQIDNHYARYLLEHGSKVDVGNDYMKVFREAHNIVTDRSHSKVQKYYPFRVARGYLSYVIMYKDRYSDDEREEVYNDCNQILKMIEEFRKSNRDSADRRDVAECELNMNRIKTLIYSK